MIGMGNPVIKHYILINGIQMDIDAVEAFMRDLYENANLSLSSGFNPVEEVVKVVNTLRDQGKNEKTNRSHKS